MANSSDYLWNHLLNSLINKCNIARR